jgi:hypothetical protein
VGEEIAQGVPLMLYRGVDGHTAGLVEHHKALILKGYGYIESTVGLKEAVVLKGEDYDIAPCSRCLCCGRSRRRGSYRPPHV